MVCSTSKRRFWVMLPAYTRLTTESFSRLGLVVITTYSTVLDLVVLATQLRWEEVWSGGYVSWGKSTSDYPHISRYIKVGIDLLQPLRLALYIELQYIDRCNTSKVFDMKCLTIEFMGFTMDGSWTRLAPLENRIQLESDTIWRVHRGAENSILVIASEY